jgi:hypothetical protein
MSFDSRRLPRSDDRRLRAHLAAQHAAEPFSSVDTRATVRRVVELTSALGLGTRVFRGALDLRGTEVDHVWASVEGVVVDVAFPLHDGEFVAILRRFVAGDAETDELAGAAGGTDFTKRIVGEFPEPVRYRGCPVWADRHRR